MLLRALNLPDETKSAFRNLYRKNGDNYEAIHAMFPTIEKGRRYLNEMRLVDHTGCGKHYELSVYGPCRTEKGLKALLIVTPDCQLLVGRVYDNGWRDARQTDIDKYMQKYTWDIIQLKKK